MKKWSGGVILVFLFTLLILRYGMLENPLAERLLPSPFSHNSSERLDWLASGDPPAVQNPGTESLVISANTIISQLFAPRNLSDVEQRSLQTWNHLDHLISHSSGLPQAIEAIGEAVSAWESLMASLEDKKINSSMQHKVKEKQCPYSIKRMNVSEFDSDTFKLKIPCGLIQGSSVTLIGTPGGLLGNIRVDLVGTALPGEPDPPIIFHYNVRLHGDKLTEDPVIVQNTWSVANDWGAEERCPSDTDNNKKGNNSFCKLSSITTNVVSAKYIMKTDDDAFVRVDEVLTSLTAINITRGLLYGRINSDSQPHRNVESKWYISPKLLSLLCVPISSHPLLTFMKEWPDEKYPPWAHGPGYVVSYDIAKAVYKQHKEGQLKVLNSLLLHMFKLEDVAMGIWIDKMNKQGSDIKYVNEGRICIDGCENGYVLAHYQEPQEMLCLWQKLQETKRGICCGE
ncbi:hypothetical protein BHM03_00005092 [Ensete ventricosum]|nr:hypothetical protein BHM03_00005092 [Ensete ventricosum]